MAESVGGIGPSLVLSLRPVIAFSDVYERHVWQIYGFFAYRLSSRETAEDLTQLTFERALRAWGRYDPKKALPLTWLLVIARNLLIDHLRADRSDRHLPSESGHNIAAPADRPDLGIDPRVASALGGLDERAREILGLRFGAELTGPQIAELTGVSLANVQQILSRTLRRLREELEPLRDEL